MQPYRKSKIGDLLVEEGLLTKEQISYVLNIQQTQSPPPPFGEVCIEQKLISPAALGKVLSKHHRRIPLGELLVHLGLATPEHVEAALAQQKVTKKRLGTLLIEKGVLSTRGLISALYQQSQLAKQSEGASFALTSLRISQEELVAALATAREQQQPLATVLMEKHHLNKGEVGQVLSAFYRCPFVEYDENVAIAPDLVQEINPNYLRANYWVPLRATKDWVEVLIDDPQSFTKLRDIKRLFPGKRIRCCVGLRDDILKYMAAIGGEKVSPSSPDSLTTILDQLEAEGHEDHEEELAEALLNENDSAIVRLVNQIIGDAHKMGASDIHIEPYDDKRETIVRFRIDGVCHEHLRIPAAYRRAFVSRLKIMAQLDIAERRKPQDGKIRLQLPEGGLELRVATIPTSWGSEDVVLRILPANEPLPVEQLNMSKRNLQEFLRLLEKPYGLILCVGPTGAGKTTTLHSALGHINTPIRKIWTAEDPVEISQYGLRQVQVHPKIGFTFAAAMRAFLRADPDVIMVGEIRDQETAEIVIEASLTGHLVLSTLHTNSAAETVTRLLEMGIDPFNFADALLGVLGQRLARTICLQCKEHIHPAKDEYDALAYGYGEEAFSRLGIEYNERFLLAHGKGCDACHHTGYRGRLGLHELLVITDELRSLIHTRAPASELLKIAKAQGMTTLVQDGIMKILQGWTDYNQVKAVAMR